LTDSLDRIQRTLKPSVRNIIAPSVPSSTDTCPPDCNGNGIADACDISENKSNDCQPTGIPDECEPDFDADGVIDACDPDIDNDGVTNEFDVCNETQVGVEVSPWEPPWATSMLIAA
jgi:hypothetical protein